LRRHAAGSVAHRLGDRRGSQRGPGSRRVPDGRLRPAGPAAVAPRASPEAPPGGGCVMDATELCFTPATELGRLIRTRALSPVELADAVLARIERVNPTINAYLTVTADLARSEAKAAEARALRGDLIGPLDGIPYSIKDLEPTAGIRT